MNKYTFGDFSSGKKIKSLIKKFDEFNCDETNISNALNLCSESWHLTDFIFEEYNSELGFRTLGDFRESLYPECFNLKIMHDLGNASKHFNLTSPKSKIKITQKHNGAFSAAFSKGFNTSHLEIIMEDNSKLDFYFVMENVINFWKKYFKETLKIDLVKIE